MISIPEIFCWTKMGAESREDLDQIIRRKELERQAGEGVFCWGVGNRPVKGAISLLSSLKKPRVLFSKMPSKPQKKDSESPVILLWTHYHDQEGNIVPLPSNVLVTSRGNEGGKKKVHFALFCFSETPLKVSNHGVLFSDSLRHPSTDNKLAPPHVTAVVKRKVDESTGIKYEIAFHADLVAPFYAQLDKPKRLNNDQIQLLENVAKGDVADWMKVSKKLRAIR